MYLKCHTIPIDELLKQFMEEIKNESIEIYNECSLQHELGIFFKSSLLILKYNLSETLNIFKLTTQLNMKLTL